MDRKKNSINVVPDL